MAKQVIKKGGAKEPFSKEKIRKSIEIAANAAGLPSERINEVVNPVLDVISQLAASKEEITTFEIGENILKELNKIDPTVAEVWFKYNWERKGRF